MTANGAGQLREKVTFQRRDESPDGHGNELGGWTDQFSEPCRLTPRLGGEEVIAARMSGVQPYIMTVRSSRRTRSVSAGWRAFDTRKGTGENGEPERLFEILSIADVDEKNAYIDFLVREGVPG
jgi:head-tail adaptor